jgi:hypothetical protein
MTTKKSTPRPAAPPVAYHHHAAPGDIRDVPVDEQFNYRSSERARLLEELRQALVAGAMGDALTNAKSGTTVTLRDGTKITRS